MSIQLGEYTLDLNTMTFTRNGETVPRSVVLNTFVKSTQPIEQSDYRRLDYKAPHLPNGLLCSKYALYYRQEMDNETLAVIRCGDLIMVILVDKDNNIKKSIGVKYYE